MTNHEENELSMFRAVISNLSDHQAIVESIPIFKTAFEELVSTVDKIMEVDEAYITISKGKTVDKHKTEEEMVNLIIALGGLGYSFAKRNGMEDAKQIFKTSRRSLLRLRDNDCLVRCKSIANLLANNIDALADYGVTQEKLDELNAKVTAFESSMAKKETGVASSTAYRKELSALFDEGSDLLNDELDGFVDSMRESNINFYNTYKAARVIRDL